MRKVFIEGEGYRESTRQSGLAEAFVDKVLCVVIRTDVYAAVLISVVATLAARWGTTGWSAYPPRRNPPQGEPVAAVAHRQRPCYWGGAPERPPSPPPRTTQCLDTLAPPAWPVPLAIVIVVIRQCRTLAITQNSIVVQLMEWPVLTITVVVWSTIVQCHRQTGLRPGLLRVTLRYRIRLRRRRQETRSRITSTTVAAVVVAEAQRSTKMAVERGSYCGSCETFLMDTCELHSN